MGFDDFFENKRKYHENYGNNLSYDSHRYSHTPDQSANGPFGQVNWSNILKKISKNKKLKIIVIIAGIVILAIAIFMMIIFMPLITKLFNYISQHGLQGILDGITGFLDKIVKGSGK